MAGEMKAAFEKMRRERAEHEAALPGVRRDGEEALRRLMPVAMSDTGQSRRIAAFLLGCYNGFRFPFDLTDFRGLDRALFDDCMAVLRMDASPLKEVHLYFEDGGAMFERLAKDWNMTDMVKLKAAAKTAGYDPGAR